MIRINFTESESVKQILLKVGYLETLTVTKPTGVLESLSLSFCFFKIDFPNTVQQ